jgi:hypothetical protein
MKKEKNRSGKYSQYSANYSQRWEYSSPGVTVIFREIFPVHRAKYLNSSEYFF